MLVPAEGKSRIFVEVFDVEEDKLRELDALEAPYDYWRETAHLEECGKDVEIYVHDAPRPRGSPSCLRETGSRRPGKSRSSKAGIIFFF